MQSAEIKLSSNIADTHQLLAAGGHDVAHGGSVHDQSNKGGVQSSWTDSQQYMAAAPLVALCKDEKKTDDYGCSAMDVTADDHLGESTVQYQGAAPYAEREEQYSSAAEQGALAGPSWPKRPNKGTVRYRKRPRMSTGLHSLGFGCANMAYSPQDKAFFDTAYLRNLKPGKRSRIKIMGRVSMSETQVRV